jgi:UDP-glucuronate decarboxylase
MNSRDDFTGPVNVGNPNEFTIELAQKIIELTGSKSKLLNQVTVRRSYADRYFF